MSKSNSDFTHPKNVSFWCTRCTLCCGDTDTRIRHILVLKKESETLSKTISSPVETFARRISRHEPYVYEIRKNKDGKCVFLQNDSCAIYSSRPLICRYYPFELRPQENEKYVFCFTTECPGVGVGRPLRESHFKELFQLARKHLGPSRAVEVLRGSV